MYVRATLVAVIAAALPLAGGTAHASCLDDATSRNLEEGYTPSPKSEYWQWISVDNYVQQYGPLTVTVQGDALVGDYSSFATTDVPAWAQVVAANAVDTTTDFADCVAG